MATAVTATLLGAGAPGAVAFGTRFAPRALPSAAQIDAVALPAVDALIEEQLPHGGFRDPVRGVLGEGGLTRVVFAALHQAARLSGPQQQARVALAQRGLGRGIEGNQLLPKWPLALLVEDGLQRFLEDPDDLLQKLRGLDGSLQASGVAEVCYLQPDCFNNYSLTNEVLDLELARTGITGAPPGTRLADPRLRTRALHWLGTRLPQTTSETASVLAPGVRGAQRAAALSDTSDYPLAYQAFCTAMLTRAATLGGAQLPGAAWRLLHAALWELVGMTAPDGEISWMGRGQDEVWTLAAALYAGLQGSVLIARVDAPLAARLRELAALELPALKARLGQTGLRPKPNADLTPAGLDGYSSAIGAGSLAIDWLELARDVLPEVHGPLAPLPSERAGGRSEDAAGNGLLTLRAGGVWLGVHRVDRGRDPRLGWGLLRALHRRADGRWESLISERPIVPTGAGDPPAGPVLARGGRFSYPQVAASGVDANAITLRGAWRGGAGTVAGTWRWTAGRASARLQSACPRGASLRFTEWLPSSGQLARGPSSLARGGFAVRFSRKISVAVVPGGNWGSAREPHMQAYRVAVRCTGAPLRVAWTGHELATG